MIEVYGYKNHITLFDEETRREMKIPRESLRQVISDLQQHLEWDFNEVALPEPNKGSFQEKMTEGVQELFGDNMKIFAISLDTEPGPHGGTINLTPHHYEEDQE